MRRGWWHGLRLLLLVAAGLLFFAPIWMMVVGSLKPDHLVLAQAGSWRAFWPVEASWQNYADALRRTDYVRFLFNSTLITLVSVGLGLVVNAMAGYALARLRWRGQAWVLALTLGLLVIPLEAIAVPLFYQVSLLGLRDTYWAQILPFIADAFAIYLFYSFFVDLPRELEDAAALDGAGPWRTFWWVIVPNARSVFASVAILSFLMRWGNYLWPLLVTTGPEVRPLPLAIATFYTLPPLQWGDILAFGVLMVAPVVCIFILFQGWFVRGVAASAIKG